RHALVAQPLGQYVGEGPRVLGHQHSHGLAPARGVAAGVASGSLTATRRPPSGRVRRATVPPCASAMAAAIASPQPPPPLAPPRRRAALFSRRGGPAAGGWRGGACCSPCRGPGPPPPVSTASTATAPSAPVATLIQPPSTLCPTALSMTLSTMRLSRGWLPATHAPPGLSVFCTVSFLAVIAPARAVRAAEARAPSDSTARPGRTPCCARASASQPSSSSSTPSTSAPSPPAPA